MTKMNFSRLIESYHQPQNRLYAARDARINRGETVIDLVSGNVHEQGIVFPPELLRQIMERAQSDVAIYRPDPLGLRSAREAISRCYARNGLTIPADHIVLTPGTSFSYWAVFKILTDSGDHVLSPEPTYPLFDSIAALTETTLSPYKLREGTRWSIDIDSVRSVVQPQSKALLLVSPHNPTGAVATAEEIEAIAAIAAEQSLAIISDEVFSPFLFTNASLPRPATTPAPLVFTLNGFSKMLALPGIKLGWIAVTGRDEWVTRSLKALEMMLDTFLPVNDWAQHATAALLEESTAFQISYRRSIEQRTATVVQRLTADRMTFVRPEGGFYIAVSLPPGIDEESFCLRVLERQGILLHPGYFYEAEGSHIVFSTVHKPETFSAAWTLVMSELSAS